MQDSITRYLAALGSETDRRALRNILNAIGDRYSSAALNSAGLVIKAGGGLLAKIGATAFLGVANGVLVSIAAATDMPSLLGINVGAGAFNVACFFVDSAGVVTVAGGREGATLAAVKFPQFPQGKALVGFLVITGVAAFTGNTTALDAGTTTYVSPVGAFDPTVLV